MRHTTIRSTLGLVALAALVAAILAACGEKPRESGIQEAFAKHKDELYAIPGVNSITIYSGEGAGGDRIEISVYRGEKTPELEAAVPDEIEGYPVTIVERDPPEEHKVDIQGSIRSITSADVSAQEQGTVGSILVEGDPKDKVSIYDKASVAVTADTSIWLPMGEGKDFISFADLKEGDYVIVAFTGPVAESYPVQATAADIEVLPKI